ncbi:MAG: VCBS repeat-containing protein, partial [Planctomycetes bacterium]|nr:VCBS repeat-containing protein [Planctomycetota bacterium]
DGDGDLDLIAGSFGDSYGQGKGGGVYLARNIGKPGKPEFAALETLIEPSAKGCSEPTRPDAGLYVEAVDYDGDGDLDLVVGGYSMWTPKPRKLSAAEQKRADELTAQKNRLTTERTAVNRKISKEVADATAGLDHSSKEYRAAASAVYAKHREDTLAYSKKYSALTKELGELVPGSQRKSFVWLYERK